MADQLPDPLKLPPLPSAPPPMPPAARALPPLPGKPNAGGPPLPGGLPPMPAAGPTSGMPLPPAPMPASRSVAPAPAPAPAPVPASIEPSRDALRPQGPSVEKLEFEKKLADMEKRLQEEREKALLATLKNQEEAATAARVEVSIKELQDKLRRDRRDQEQEEAKRKLETKAAELEARLAAERETWVTTLKGQMQSRQSQDKEIETHFAMRLQEMERRWLEEKAQWQKLALAKDEEIRNLRSLAEKLKGADGDLAKTSAEKKILEDRVNELTRDRTEAYARLQNAAEKEKEAMQLRADLTLARAQGTMLQERLEREVQSVRSTAREREERLLSDQERLQRDLGTITERLRGEHEVALRRVRDESQSEIARQKSEAQAEILRQETTLRLMREEAQTDAARHKEALDHATVEIQRLRAVCGALERQAAMSRTQLNEAQKAIAETEKLQEQYKAEILAQQRKFVERENDIRLELEAQSKILVETEKARFKAQVQDEVNQRTAQIIERVNQEREAEADQRDGLARGKRDAERLVANLREELSAVRVEFGDFKERLAAAQLTHQRLEEDKTKLELLVTAQSVQIQNGQQAIEELRMRLIRESETTKDSALLKETAEKKLIMEQEERERVIAALRADFKAQRDAHMTQMCADWESQVRALQMQWSTQQASLENTIEQLRGRLVAAGVSLPPAAPEAPAAPSSL